MSAKEILDNLRNKDCYVNNETILTFDEAKLLLDYITNLQEELAFIKNDYKKVVSSNDDNIVIINKAIEYIKLHTEERVYKEPYNIDGFPDRVEYFIKGKWNLLNILNGGDKE